MISDLERLAALHQNGQLDDAEFKLAKEKLLNGGSGDDQITLRLELTEAQIKLSENEKNWPMTARYFDGGVGEDGTVHPPDLESKLLLRGCLIILPFFMAKLLFEVNNFAWYHWVFAAFLVLVFAAGIFLVATGFISHKTTLQRFLAAQSEHNTEQATLRTRIAELQQQLT